MQQDRSTSGVVEVVVTGFFSTHHFLHSQAGVVGELTLLAFGRGGVFRGGDGRELVVERTSWWRGWHELREGEIVVGTARLLSFWRRSMSVGFRGQMYELVPAGFWSRDWHLIDQSGAVIVDVEPRGWFKRGAYLSLARRVPPDLAVFAYYLVNARWQEQSAAASAAAGS